MPELPEVETTTKTLNERLRNLTITNVWSGYDSPFFKGKRNIKDPAYFKHLKKEIVGKKILGVERIGKNIVFRLTGEKILLAHMKMTGHFLIGKYAFKEKSWAPKDKKSSLGDPTNRFIRFVVALSDKNHLAFSDMRKFAKICLIENNDIRKDEELKNIGPDALDLAWTPDKLLAKTTTRKNAPIKLALMDQSLIAGIGNIYSDEILWASKIRPDRKAGSLGKDEAKKIISFARLILKKGVSLGGDSMSDYRKPDGQKGAFQYHHKAYRRTGLPCLRRNCDGIIKRMILGGRSAHFCPKCQK